jgi:hypothetical protein
MRLKNREIRAVKLSEQENIPNLKDTTTPEERWAMAWRLALDVWAFKGEPVAEPGLHRHIVRVFRRKS